MLYLLLEQTTILKFLLKCHYIIQSVKTLDIKCLSLHALRKHIDRLIEQKTVEKYLRIYQYLQKISRYLMYNYYSFVTITTFFIYKLIEMPTKIRLRYPYLCNNSYPNKSFLIFFFLFKIKM